MSGSNGDSPPTDGLKRSLEQSAFAAVTPGSTPTAADIWGALGGPRGLVESLLPGLAFLTVYSLTQSLLWSVGAPVVVSIGFILTRLVQRSPIQPALVGFLGIAASAAVAILSGRPENNFVLGLWVNGLSLTVLLLSLIVGLGLLKFLGTWLILLWDPLRFFFTPGPVKAARVHEQAIKHFKVGAERRTHGRTGVLIYLSMREHRAEIVADEPIAEKVPAEVWGEAMADMLVEIRKGCIAEGLAAGVADVGRVLAEHFPRDEDDQNELPDRLIEV